MQRLVKAELVEVHPRLRGVLYENAVDNDGNGGSSPLTRGSVTPEDELFNEKGFIPAYAGF